MRIADEKKITLVKKFPNGNKVIREFITERKGMPVQVIRSIEVFNCGLKKTVREFSVTKELGNKAYTNNVNSGFELVE